MSPSRTMERSSKLAPLTLVSKYYPVANYSYPRSEGATTPCYNSTRPSSSSKSSFEDIPRSSSPLSSPPSLVDDRTDSEASADVDDYRYHAHTNQLWDTFWMSEQHQHHILDDGHKKKPVTMAAAAAAAARPAYTPPSRVPPQVPAKDYPALISSPQRSRRRPQGPRSQASNGCWPLSDHSPQQRPEQTRKPSPTYSAFPKIVNVPSPASTRPSSSSQLPTGACENRLSGTDARCPPQQAPPPPASLYSRPGSPHPRAFSPASLKALQRPATSHSSRPSSPMDYPYHYPSPPPTAPLPALPANCPKAPHLAHPSSNVSQQSHAQLQTQPPNHTIRPYKSTTQLRRSPPEPLPVSVFEYDSDSDCTDDESSPLESPALSFFRFHRRSQSPRNNNNNDDIFTRRRGSASKVASSTTAHQSLIDATEKENCKRRKRNNTIDGLPRVVKQSEVLSRMLGLRSR